jgi:hypothetical protein
MRNISEKKLYRNSKHTYYAQFFSPKNRAVYETMWRNVVEPEAAERRIIYGLRPS